MLWYSPSTGHFVAGIEIPRTPYVPGGRGMKLSSSPSHVSVNCPWFSAVTVRGSPAMKVLTIQSGFFASVMANVTR